MRHRRRHGFAVGVTEVIFGHVAVKMLLRAVLVDALEPALTYEKCLDRVGVDSARVEPGTGVPTYGDC